MAERGKRRWGAQGGVFANKQLFHEGKCQKHNTFTRRSNAQYKALCDDGDDDRDKDDGDDDDDTADNRVLGNH